MDHSEREKLKQDVGSRYAEAKNDAEKASALEMLIEAHFWRSVEAYGEKHPGFDVYAAHWLEAQKDRVGEKESLQISEGAFEILRKKYPQPKSPRIPPGMSYWHSPRGMKIALSHKGR